MVTYPLTELAAPNWVIEYVDTIPDRYKLLAARFRILSLLFSFANFSRMLRADIVVTFDLGPAPLLAVWLRRVTRGSALRWYFISINTSTLFERAARRRFRSLLVRTYLSGCSKVICLAKFQVRALIRFRVAQNRIAVIPLGIDAPFFSQQKAKREPYILSVGYDMARDYDFLLAVASRLTYPVRIITARHIISPDRELPENVQVDYSLPISEVRKAYASAKIVVVPLRPNIDGVGSDCSGQTVVLESMASGAPVMVTERPWVQEYLRRTEEYIPLPQDVQQATDAIDSLWKAEELLRKIGDSGMKAVQSRYNVTSFSRALIALIESEALTEINP